MDRDRESDVTVTGVGPAGSGENQGSLGMERNGQGGVGEYL